jgi:diketogulonate reductase-like aldo/keto reductase
MKEAQIPTIGPMPALGLGTWRLTGMQCEKSIRAALELGYRHIDTAVLYDNHAEIARAIKEVPREQLFLVSKIIYEDLEPKHVKTACKRILKELEIEYLDLLLIHWPSSHVAPEKTLEAMTALQAEKLILHLGVSNFDLDQLQRLERYRFPILTNQIELHPYLQEWELADYCQEKKIILTAYRPIQRGDVAQETLLQQIGAAHHKTAIQVTLRWLFQRGIVSIPKASSKEHLLENREIFDFSLNTREMDQISQMHRGKRFGNQLAT